MAAIAPPIVPAAAPAPTVVTVTVAQSPETNLATTFLATDPFVINYPTLTFVLLAVVAGGAPQNGLRTHRAGYSHVGRTTHSQ